MRKSKIYWIINSLCILTAFICFGILLKRPPEIALPSNISSIIVLLVTVLVVYGLKAFRLYMVLAGTKISVREHLRQFCKTALVNIFFPFKLGELFRAYCYGHLIRNYAKGILAILLDRFSDTLALLTILFFIAFVKDISAVAIIYLLSIFMIFLVLVYCIFPEFYTYWNRYLLREPATKNRLRYLSLLAFLYKWYQDCRALVHGRIVGLYVISLVAWSVEISGMALAVRWASQVWNTKFISAYLEAALGIREFVFQRWFLIFSCVVLVASLLIMYGIKILYEGRKARV